MPALAKTRYVPYLPDFLSLCERNYAQLRFFLPRQQRAGQRCVIHLNASDSYQVELLELCKYTTTIRIELISQSVTLWLKPRFEVRLYHDARLAEVLSCQHVRQFKAVYNYPNVDMLLPDEKRQINLLLRDWLNLCARRGYQNNGIPA
jgi:uncharacterized protein YqiB (DUF1249 family)